MLSKLLVNQNIRAKGGRRSFQLSEGALNLNLTTPGDYVVETEAIKTISKRCKICYKLVKKTIFSDNGHNTAKDVTF